MASLNDRDREGLIKKILEDTGLDKFGEGVGQAFNLDSEDRRDARLPEDVRRALTAHSSRDVQDRVYGEGLQFMSSALLKELSKVDWSWLP